MLHVVATRMGIGIYDPEWFEIRLSLFEAITFPSVTKQTNQNFTWLLVVDREMPEIARQKLSRIVDWHPRVIFLPVEMKTDFVPAVSAWCKSQRPADGQMLTTRMDDDDAIRTDAFQHLHDMADRARQEDSTYGIFSFDVGARWDPMTNSAYKAYHHSLGIGLSMLEPVKEARTVYSRPHLEIKTLMAPKGAFIESIGGSTPQWLYTHHALSDTDTGDQSRIKKIREHKLRFTLDAQQLASFGMDADAISMLPTLLKHAEKSESAFRVSTQGTGIEGKIKTLREQLANANAAEATDIQEKIAALNKDRISKGNNVVR